MVCSRYYRTVCLTLAVKLSLLVSQALGLFKEMRWGRIAVYDNFNNGETLRSLSD